MKLRAAADFAVHPDAPGMNLHDVLGDGEAQSSAAELARARSVHTEKTFKDARLIRFRDADASVGYGEHDFAIALFGADDDFAAGKRVLQCVVEQVLQHFGETAAVA